MNAFIPSPVYNIEFSWKWGDHLITKIVICQVEEDNELIGLTDDIYNIYKKEYKDIEIYYFTSKQEATNFVYVKFIQEKDEVDDENEVDMIIESGCVGHLIKGELTGRMSPPKLLKVYPI